MRDSAEIADRRESWMKERERRERELYELYGDGDKGTDAFDVVVSGLGWILRAVGLYGRGVRNALDVRLNRLVLELDTLPTEFDGYTVLHITDPHFDATHRTEDAVLNAIAGVETDLCVLTGDYRSRFHGDFGHVFPPLKAMVDAVSIRDGCFATLGNHDTLRMIEPLEAMGIRVLGNESVRISRGGSEIHITGIDDVEAYYSEWSGKALVESPEGFKIALAHSPSMAEEAAGAEFDLYLCGHTHGGQIALPGGIPIATRMRGGHRRRASGLWRVGAMLGITSNGCGTSILPVRFNAAPEVVLLTLRVG